MTGFFAYCVGLFPTMTRPAWVQSLVDGAVDGVTKIRQLDHWIPVGDIAVALAFVLAVWLIAFGIRVVRIVVSAFLGGGLNGGG